MRQLGQIALLLAILNCSVGFGMDHYSIRADAPVQNSSYNNFSSLLSKSSFVAWSNTSDMSPMLLHTAVIPQKVDLRRLSSRSALSHPLIPHWSQYSFFLRFPKSCGWSSDSNEGQACIDVLLDQDDNGSLSIYEIPSMRQFVLLDGYKKGVEAHDDMTRMGLNRFLDDDEPPNRPLL